MLISIVSFFLLSCTNSTGRESSFSWQIAEGSRIIVKLSRHPYSEALISRLTEFEELTGIDVEYTVAREDLYYEDLDKSMSARRTRPDVFMTGAYHIWGYASRGIVENLDSYIQSSSLTDVRYDSTDFYDGIISSLRWEPGNKELGTGPLLALPMGFELNTLAYNKRIFDELGLEAPETYDELLKLCSVLKEYNGPGSYPIALRGTRDWSSIHSAYMTAYTAFGAEDFKLNDQGILEPAIDSPESLAMNRYWVDLVRKGATPSRETQNWYEVGFALGDGRSAMMFDADIVAYFQNIPGYSKEAGNIAWAPPPVVNRGDVKKSNMWIWSLAMHSEARNKTAAWLFIQYFTSREFQLWAALEQNSVNPPRRSVFEDPQLQEMLSLSEGYTETFNALIKTSKIQFTPRKDVMELTDIWAAGVQKMILEPDSRIDQVLKELKTEMQRTASGNEKD